MGLLEAWSLVLKGSQHKNGLYWVKVLPKLGIAWFMGAFRGFVTIPFACRMVYLFATVFRNHGWEKILPWIELPVLCFFACSLISAQTG
jgi:hypothetical protein